MKGKDSEALVSEREVRAAVLLYSGAD